MIITYKGMTDKRKIIFGVLIYIVALASIFIYYKINNPDSLNIEIKAVADSGSVTFRGMSIDEKWYNPKDVITSNSNWIEDDTGFLFTAVDESSLYLKIPKGESYGITFDVGPEQGIVQIVVEDEMLEIDLQSDADVEEGLSFDLKMLSEIGLGEYEKNRNGAVVICALVIIMLMFVVFCNGGKKKSANKKQRNDAVEILRFAMIMCVCVHHYCGYIRGGI